MKKYLILFAAICVLLFVAGCTEQEEISRGESSSASTGEESSHADQSFESSVEESSYIVEISIPWSVKDGIPIAPV